MEDYNRRHYCPLRGPSDDHTGEISTKHKGIRADVIKGYWDKDGGEGSASEKSIRIDGAHRCRDGKRGRGSAKRHNFQHLGIKTEVMVEH